MQAFFMMSGQARVKAWGAVCQEGHVCSTHHALVLWGWEKAAVQEGITEGTTQLCLSPSFQRKCPLEYQLLAEMVTEAHQSYTASLMLN